MVSMAVGPLTTTKSMKLRFYRPRARAVPLLDARGTGEATFGGQHLHPANFELGAHLGGIARGEKTFRVDVGELQRGGEPQLKRRVGLLLRLGSEGGLRFSLLQ